MGKNNGGPSGGDGNDSGGGIAAEPSRLCTFPEDCISTILSFTSPRDACVVASVSRIFRSAAQSDIVWERFLPPDYLSLVPQSWIFSSKKELCLSLGVLIDDGKKCFWLEQPSGKKCYMLSARDLTIIWGDTPAYWRWVSLPEARFEEVAELLNVCWLEIRGKMNTRVLSPGTLYSAYIVFKMTEECYGFEFEPIRTEVAVVGSNVPGRFFWFDVEPKMRRDGWMEIELGEFFNNGGMDSDEIEMSASETWGDWKSGLIVQGIEIRPKEGNSG